MTFKPGFHKAAMELVAAYDLEPVNATDDDATIMAQVLKESSVQGRLWDVLGNNVTDYKPGQLEAIIQYLAHTELHGWDE